MQRPLLDSILAYVEVNRSVFPAEFLCIFDGCCLRFFDEEMIQETQCLIDDRSR